MDLQLTEEQVRFFQDNGYLSIDRVTTEEEVEWFRRLYDEIIADPGPLSVDFPDGRGASGGIVQVFNPELQRPEIRETSFYRNATHIASRLLGMEPSELVGGSSSRTSSHMIYKPPGRGRDVPWHQDEAYWDNVEWLANALSVWMPMDPVTVDSGCMQFIPGSNKSDVLRYQAQEGKQPLVLDEPIDETAAVACPLQPGGATVHHCRTLHFTAPNTSDHPRRAYSLVFQGEPTRREVPVQRPWLEKFRKETAPERL